ncbi:Granulin [Macleaya cordata]|uniref:Granulin n=1 Tax=Macleaya cordata TaxID=56857 RepID=A0A200R194_MACCD|nr:Granulin [Macleaya cordata]
MSRLKTQLVLHIFFICASLFSTHCLSLESESFSILSHDSDESSFVVSEERVVELFERWREKHGKVYKHEEEKKFKFESFKKNLKYIMERNYLKKMKKRGLRNDDDELIGHHEVGLNVFADMNNEEFREVYLSSKMAKPRKNHKMISELRKMEGQMMNCEAPASVDWRKKGVITAVKNQGQCGSCWAFSSTGAMESINAIVTGDLISLSEQELVDCDTSCNGCGGGNMDYAFEWVINNGGIDTESGYPYTAQDGTCNITKVETKVVTIDGYEDVAQEENALLCSVVNQPISVGIDGSALDFQLYTGGIYDGECSADPKDIDHAVLIVGYGSKDDQDYWIVKNSWGTGWGMGGYIYIKRNTDLEYGVCAINAMASYPTKNSVSPSPFPSPVIPPPPPPPPPSPCPSKCGEITYCPSDETCCCILDFYGVCLIYGCCEYENAVCCPDSIYCCPQDYPICAIEYGLCLRNSGDSIGVAAKKRKMAKPKFPWTKCDGTEEKHSPHQPNSLLWKRNHHHQFAAFR